MIHGMFISINNYLLKFMQLKSMRLNLFIYGTDATLTMIKNCTYTNEAVSYTHLDVYKRQ